MHRTLRRKRTPAKEVAQTEERAGPAREHRPRHIARRDAPLHGLAMRFRPVSGLAGWLKSGKRGQSHFYEQRGSIVRRRKMTLTPFFRSLAMSAAFPERELQWHEGGLRLLTVAGAAPASHRLPDTWKRRGV